MLETRVIPCLLLRNRALVKTVGFKKPSYIGDPVNTVRIYNDKEVDELVILDITATRQNKPISLQLLEEVASECFMPLTYGGGIRTLDDIKSVFSLGVEKVVLNTTAALDPNIVRMAAERFGSQSIVVSIDARRRRIRGGYEVMICGGTEKTGRDPVEQAQRMTEIGAGEILLTSMDRDGTMTGYDLDLVTSVTKAVTTPVIACGGAGGLSDLREAVEVGGAAAVAAGSMLVYQGPNRAVLINFPTRAELQDALGTARRRSE